MSDNNKSEKKEKDLQDKDISDLTEEEYKEKELEDLETESNMQAHPSLIKRIIRKLKKK